MMLANSSVLQWQLPKHPSDQNGTVRDSEPVNIDSLENVLRAAPVKIQPSPQCGTFLPAAEALRGAYGGGCCAEPVCRFFPPRHHLSSFRLRHCTSRGPRGELIKFDQTWKDEIVYKVNGEGNAESSCSMKYRGTTGVFWVACGAGCWVAVGTGILPHSGYWTHLGRPL